VTTPETNGPGEPTGALSVSTAPPPAPRRWWTAVPHHLGRARTSTVVLTLLFVGLYALYLNVRPPDPPAGAPSGSTVQTSAPAATGPAEPTETSAPTTTAPTTEPTTAPSPTEESGPAGESPGQTPTTVQPTTTEAPATQAPATPPRTTAASPTP
jgi:cytoskeletal protein RodZ